MRIRSTNVAVPKPNGGRSKRLTGMDKRPVGSIEVFAPGPHHGDGPGVVGDFVGDRQHHGGADKAVYAFSREELDFWAGEIGRDLPDGGFGENLTTEGLDLEALVLGQELRIADAVLQVSIPRQPCQTFGRHMAVPRWVKRFTEHGRCGAYLRVLHPGTIRPGDAIVVGSRPAHGVTMLTAFAAAMGDDAAAGTVVAAGCLPARYHDQLVARIDA